MRSALRNQLCRNPQSALRNTRGVGEVGWDTTWAKRPIIGPLRLPDVESGPGAKAVVSL